MPVLASAVRIAQLDAAFVSAAAERLDVLAHTGARFRAPYAVLALHALLRCAAPQGDAAGEVRCARALQPRWRAHPSCKF